MITFFHGFLPPSRTDILDVFVSRILNSRLTHLVRVGIPEIDCANVTLDPVYVALQITGDFTVSVTLKTAGIESSSLSDLRCRSFSGRKLIFNFTTSFFMAVFWDELGKKKKKTK